MYILKYFTILTLLSFLSCNKDESTPFVTPINDINISDENSSNDINTSDENNNSVVVTSTFNQYDTDNDGLADAYEADFNLTVGIIDANNSQLDPLFIEQWHLKNTLFPMADINISPVWRETLGTKEIVVSVVDTGIDTLHGDLNVDLNRSFRYSDLSSNCSPTTAQLYNDNSGSAHGTACAGIIAAKGWNGIGVRGIAPNISLVGLNVFSKPDDDSFSSALQRDGIDVSSNSWGGGGANWLFDDVVSVEAIRNGIMNGRDSKGISYIFASGNDTANANFQSILTSGYVVAVSAVDSTGKYESYSDYGANILVAAPGGAANYNTNPAIVTTDLHGLSNGMDVYREHWDTPENSEGDYTNSMNGTSAACPVVSGVVSLMLSVNNALTYRDIQYILAITAKKNDSEDESWRYNGVDLPISDKYGFGLVDAASAVSVSKDFISLGAEITTSHLYDVNISIDTPNTVLLESEFEEDFTITQVQLEIKTNHDNNGKLKILLQSPSGTISTLAYGDTILYDRYEPWTFLSVQFLNEKSKGVWRVYILDEGESNSGELQEWKITLKGYSR